MHGDFDYRRTIARLQPEVEELIGGPEFFADGWVLLPHSQGTIMTALSFVEREQHGAIKRYEISRHHFPMKAWQSSVTRTLSVLQATISSKQ